MKAWQKNTLVICCLLGIVLSVINHVRNNINYIDEIKAPVHVNIEIDKNYKSEISIMAALNSGDIFLPLSLEGSDELENFVLYTEINVGNPTPPFIRELYLTIPKETAQKTLYAIDSISIFIGNKMFYFSHSEVINFQSREQNEVLLYKLPGLEYKKSIITSLIKLQPFINWYGDFNFVIKALLVFCTDLITKPAKLSISWFFLICFLVLCRSSIEKSYISLKTQKVYLLELLLLALIVLIGFILRLNDYDRYSAWLDELYSAVMASNPNEPFLNTFRDPGNPPLYFIILRFWFIVFGWTEQSGRFLSVILGSAAIITLYLFVKQFAGKKTAFLAALYMAISAYFIGYSQEMRSYILMVLLVPIVVLRFLVIIQKQDFSFKSLLWYIIPSALLVNTHYYGCFFIFINFIFFTIYSIHTKTFNWKNMGLFFSGSLIVALLLLPYFIFTALHNALLNSGFNTWILKPGLLMTGLAVIIPFLCILYLFLRKISFSKKMTVSCMCFFDYAVFMISILYLMVFGISLYRPILTIKYLIILYPLIISIIAMLIIYFFLNNSNLIKFLCLIIGINWLATGYEAIRGGKTDVYHEAITYISRNSEANPDKTNIEIVIYDLNVFASFYNYKQLPEFNTGSNYDILYMNPLHKSQEEMLLEIENLGIDYSRILRIRINNSKSVFKIYSE
jgi:hypothetical protein